MHAKYRNNSKEARRAFLEKLVNFRVIIGHDLDHYVLKLLEVRGRLHYTGENISDERFEEILLQELTDDYEFVQMTSVHSLYFGIDRVQSAVRNLHIDRLS